MTERLTNVMIAAGVKHLRLARNGGCGEGDDGALTAVIYTAMLAASGIETGTAKSEALSAEHESPTGKAGDAQRQPNDPTYS